MATSTHPAMDYLRQLPVAEQLRIVEELWDNIAASGEKVPLPEWHREEAQKRAAELAADPSIALSREQLWQDVRETNGH